MLLYFSSLLPYLYIIIWTLGQPILLQILYVNKHLSIYLQEIFTYPVSYFVKWRNKYSGNFDNVIFFVNHSCPHLLCTIIYVHVCTTMRQKVLSRPGTHCIYLIQSPLSGSSTTESSDHLHAVYATLHSAMIIDRSIIIFTQILWH